MEKKAADKKKYIDLLLLLVMATLLITVFVCGEKLTGSRSYEFTTAAKAVYGHDGSIYVIDDGKSAINVVDRENMLKERLIGGRYERFFYAEDVAEGSSEKGGAHTLYIADTAYSEAEDGSTLEEHRVIEYKNGKYSVIRNAGENAIYEVQTRDGELYALSQEDYGLSLMKYEGDGEWTLKERYYNGDALTDATVDLYTGCAAISTRRGAVRVMRSGSGAWKTLTPDGSHLMPQSISAAGGVVWFSELFAGRVCRFFEEDTGSFETVYSEEDLKINRISAAQDGGSALCCDLISFYELSDAGDGRIESSYEGVIKSRGFYQTVFLWAALVICLVILIWLLRFLPALILGLLHDEAALRMTAVLVAVLAVSCFIAWSLITEEHRKEDLRDVSDMKLFTDMVVNNIDTELLSNIKWETDYGGSSYTKLRDRLDILMTKALNEGNDYYYVFYSVSGGKLRYLMNYYDSVICGEPYGRMDATYYLNVNERRCSYALKSRDADGLWLYVLTPVENVRGECVAVLEIGTDLAYRMAERRTQTLNIGMNVLCSSAVMLMLIVEVLMLMTFFERKKNELSSGKRDITHMVPLRAIVLLSYVAATLQDSFITVLSSKLYTGNLHIPDSMAAGLPLSANLLMMAVFAPVGGHISERMGSKRTLHVGIVAELSGFLICAIFGSYTGLLAGNLLMGAGLGLINVTCNTIAAMGDGMEATSESFAGVMAGLLSGLTIGAGLASILYPIGGSRLSYSVSACFMVPVFFLVAGAQDVRADKNDEEEEAKDKISFGRFLLNVRVLGFLLLILAPFMTSVSYREYFFPMFAAENGFSESRIGQIYLICGMVVLYLGPHISAFVIKRFGSFWSIVIASGAMGLNMLLFVAFPGLPTALAGMVIFSAITSFAYTCQYTFFEELPDSFMYGDGKSMGVYSVFENAGQTIGPLVYGFLLTFGYRSGVGMFCAAMLALLLLYVILMRGQKKFFR